MRLAEIRKWHKPEEYVYEYNANVIEFLLQKKKIIRSEFEKSYIYFRNTVKSLNNKEIPMNKILTQIRDVFDFDSKKINSSDISELNEKYQYKYI